MCWGLWHWIQSSVKVHSYNKRPDRKHILPEANGNIVVTAESVRSSFWLELSSLLLKNKRFMAMIYLLLKWEVLLVRDEIWEGWREACKKAATTLQRGRTLMVPNYIWCTTEIPAWIKSRERPPSQAVTGLYLPPLTFPGFGIAIFEIAKCFTGKDNYSFPK